jgi:hypothetical protein
MGVTMLNGKKLDGDNKSGVNDGPKTAFGGKGRKRPSHFPSVSLCATTRVMLLSGILALPRKANSWKKGDTKSGEDKRFVPMQSSYCSWIWWLPPSFSHMAVAERTGLSNLRI